MGEEPVKSGSSPSVGRRTALTWLIRGFLSLWALGSAVVGLAFLKAPEKEKRPAHGVVRGGTFSSLNVGEARFIRHGTTPVFVVRATETTALAFPAVCTHLRCILKWDASTETFLCPCHQGSFDRNGNVLAGPPSRPLVPYRAEVQADEIIIHI